MTNRNAKVRRKMRSGCRKTEGIESGKGGGGEEGEESCANVGMYVCSIFCLFFSCFLSTSPGSIERAFLCNPGIRLEKQGCGGPGKEGAV